MKRFALTLGFVFLLSLLASGLAFAADDSSAWSNARDSAVGVGHSVKGFFTSLFSKS